MYTYVKIRKMVYFIFFTFLLLYSWFTMLGPVQMYSIVTHIYISFLIFSSIMVYFKRLDIVPWNILRTSLLIHSKCKSLHLLTLNSLSIPLLLGNCECLLYVWVSFSFVDRFICALSLNWTNHPPYLPHLIPSSCRDPINIPGIGHTPSYLKFF